MFLLLVFAVHSHLGSFAKEDYLLGPHTFHNDAHSLPIRVELEHMQELIVAELVVEEDTAHWFCR